MNKNILDNVLIDVVNKEYGITLSSYFIDNYKKLGKISDVAHDNKIPKTKFISRTFVNKGLINDMLYTYDPFKFESLAKSELKLEYKTVDVAQSVSQTEVKQETEVEMLKRLLREKEKQLEEQHQLIVELQTENVKLKQELNDLRTKSEQKVAQDTNSGEIQNQVKEEYLNVAETTFVDIPQFPGYQINKLGIVNNHALNRSCPVYDVNGYKVVSLRKDGKTVRRRLHVLMCEVFLSNPNNYTLVKHKNEVTVNNTLSNLEWCEKK